MIWWIVVRAPAVPGPLLSPGAALSVSILGSPSLSHWEIQQRRPRPLAVFGNHRGLKESKKKKEVAALITQFGSSRAQRASEREREREVNYLIDVFKWKRKKKREEREREPLYILHYNCNKYNDKCFNADLLSLGADDDDGSARRVMMTALRCRRWLDQTRPTCSSSYSLTSRFLTFFSFFLFFLPYSLHLIDFVGRSQCRHHHQSRPPLVL